MNEICLKFGMIRIWSVLVVHFVFQILAFFHYDFMGYKKRGTHLAYTISTFIYIFEDTHLNFI